MFNSIQCEVLNNPASTYVPHRHRPSLAIKVRFGNFTQIIKLHCISLIFKNSGTNICFYFLYSCIQNVLHLILIKTPKFSLVKIII